MMIEQYVEETRNDDDEGSSCLPVNVRLHQHRSIELFGKCFVGLDVLTHSTAFVTFNDRKKTDCETQKTQKWVSKVQHK
jgi:hypothetical protein